MDVYKALRELHEEKKRLDIAIAALESRLNSAITLPDGKVRSRRGRRSMSAEEREEVSRRMSRYWASRRDKSEQAAVMLLNHAGSSGNGTSLPEHQIQEVA